MIKETHKLNNSLKEYLRLWVNKSQNYSINFRKDVYLNNSEFL